MSKSPRFEEGSGVIRPYTAPKALYNSELPYIV